MMKRNKNKVILSSIVVLLPMVIGFAYMESITKRCCYTFWF